MKLFITNKPEFDQEESSDRVHKIAFGKLSTSLAEGNIPLEIFVHYYDRDYLFGFVNKRNDLFFYSFISL